MKTTIEKDSGQTQAQDPRFKQANKEAVATLLCYTGYFLWWYLWAYGPGSANPDDYAYVFGLPEWFFYSCIVGYPIITLVLWAVVRIFFKDVPLEEQPPSDLLSGTENAENIPAKADNHHAR